MLEALNPRLFIETVHGRVLYDVGCDLRKIADIAPRARYYGPGEFSVRSARDDRRRSPAGAAGALGIAPGDIDAIRARRAPSLSPITRAASPTFAGARDPLPRRRIGRGRPQRRRRRLRGRSGGSSPLALRLRSGAACSVAGWSRSPATAGIVVADPALRGHRHLGLVMPPTCRRTWTTTRRASSRRTATAGAGGPGAREHPPPQAPAVKRRPSCG